MFRFLIVARREFLEMILRPVFIIAVLGMPLLFVGLMALAVYLTVQNKQPPLVGTVAVADATGEVADAASIEFGDEQLRRDQAERIEEVQRRAEARLEGAPGGMTDLAEAGQTSHGLARGMVEIIVEPVALEDEAAVKALTQRVRDGELIAAAVITPAVVEPPGPTSQQRAVFELDVAENLDSDHIGLIERRIGQAVVRVRAARANLDPEEAMAMLRRPAAHTSRAMKSGEVEEEGEGRRVLRQLLPALFMLLLWVSTLISGQHLLMSTIEEKSNRVMEVLLSAVSPLQLMTGKILGHCAVGLLIALLYSSVVIAGFIVGARFDSSFASIIDPMHVVYLTLFFFIAYFMVASLMAAVGSAVSDVREANTLVTPVMLLMAVPWMLWMPISQSPNGTLATVFSFVPPAAPFAMIIRLAAEEPVPAWQIPLTIVWGYLCVVGMVWMAARVFRVGVLMYGKPPTPVELLKWIRYS